MCRAITLKSLLVLCLASMSVAWAVDDKATDAKSSEGKAEASDTKAEAKVEKDAKPTADVKADAGKTEKAAEAKSAEKKPEEAKQATLNDSVAADLKSAIEAADKANKAAAKAGFDWFWDEKSGAEHLQEAIKLANAGEDKKAMQLAKLVELAGKQGLEQAAKAKKAGPSFN